MKPKKTLSMYILLVGVMGLSIVGGILAFQIFSAATKSQATPEQTAAIKPIDGSISKEAVDNLTKRIVITSTDLSRLDSITPTPIASQSAIQR
jgi:flagellar basal body-associated protein FliL